MRTLAAMKNTKDEGFNALFMTKTDFAAKFDYHVRFVHNVVLILDIMAGEGHHMQYRSKFCWEGCHPTEVVKATFTKYNIYTELSICR